MESQKPKPGNALIGTMPAIVVLIGLAAAAALGPGCGEEPPNRKTDDARQERAGIRRRQAEIRSATARIAALCTGVEQYTMDIGRYPGEDEGGLHALVAKPDYDDERMTENWSGPYVSPDEMKDPWGQRFRYELVEDNGRVVPHISSDGLDGEPDTNDDISSWSKQRL